jgi:hypoxanthine-DNA glycosylase
MMFDGILKGSDSMLHHSFNAISNSQSTILILGSFPSVKSRENSFYYMHPQNRFWIVLSEIYQDDFVNASIEVKQALLNFYHIALYDVIESCDITNSDDSSIKNVIPTDIDQLLQNTQIKHIFLNGKKAVHYFEKYHSNCRIPYNYLPSTSAANAAYTLPLLIKAWKVIKTH